MGIIALTQKPSNMEQKIAIQSYNMLASVIKRMKDEEAEIEIAETKEKIRLPMKALKLLEDVLKAMSQGKLVTIVPVATEVTTQKAAEILGCSRPHLVKLLEAEKIEYTMVGKHRRVKLETVLHYKKQMKTEQKQHIIDIMNFDEETGLYDK